MYTYSDYFDTKKKKKPYALPGDDLKDCLNALDMLLEAFMFFKADMRQEGCFHARGIEVKEDEIGTYFKTAPAERAKEQRSVSVSAELKKAMEHIRAREDATLKSGAEAPVRSVADKFGLSLGELFILLMAASVRYDLKYLRIYRYVADEMTEKSLSAGVADALLNFFLPHSGSAFEGYFEPDGRLRSYLIICDENPLSSSKLMSSIRIIDAVYRYLLGGRESVAAAKSAKADDRIFHKEFIDRVCSSCESKEGMHFRYIESNDAKDVEYALKNAAALTDKPFYMLKAADYSAYEAPVRTQSAFIMRMFPGVVLLKHDLPSGDDERYNRKIKAAFEESIRFLGRMLPGQQVYICGGSRMPDADISADMSPAILKLNMPDAMQRTDIWNYCLDREGIELQEDIVIEDIADCHALSYTAVARLCRQARETIDAAAENRLSRSLLQELLFKLDTSDFEHLATEVQVRYTWDDIYIESSQKKRLKAACDRYRLRGRVGDKWGINKKNAYGNAVILLMYGPPGTGKTMAAQAIANEVMTPLYRVDVSQIFSKYIGETQKNLSRIFDEAARRNVVLFFDEADALFTRRTEIKDSHDKYANSDTSFLLQKVEEYNGISILATNNFQSFDPAFMRRLSYVVRFERPDEDTRRAMWENMLPKEVPMAKDIDYDFMASQFKELTGSNIISVLLTAAYLAGAESRSVGMRDIILAIRYEYEKLGRLIDSDEFGRYAGYMQE